MERIKNSHGDEYRAGYVAGITDYENQKEILLISNPISYWGMGYNEAMESYNVPKR
jgi:hypothetical protein